MPIFERKEVSIHYKEYGTGFPVLVFAPGGMRSSIGYWRQAPFDPTAELAKEFRVIALDQRNAGSSRASISAADGWQTYSADHLGLLDHLGIGRCHVMGGCIGSSFCLSLIEAAPRRISAAVLQNPIGLSETNRELFLGMFDNWATELKRQRPELDGEALRSFRENMYGGDFVFAVSREFVRSCKTPLLVLAGNDDFHPTPVARELAELAPNAELVIKWKSADVIAETVKQVREFLKSHMPRGASGTA